MFQVVLVFLALQTRLAAHLALDHLIVQVASDMLCQHSVCKWLAVGDRWAKDTDIAIRFDVFPKMPNQRLLVGDASSHAVFGQMSLPASSVTISTLTHVRVCVEPRSAIGRGCGGIGAGVGRAAFRRIFPVDIVLRFCIRASDITHFGVIASMRRFEYLEIQLPKMTMRAFCTVFH